MNKRNRFPPGWDEQRVRAVLEHYEAQTEDAAYEDAASPITVAHCAGGLPPKGGRKYQRG